jgi:hypothetical protein
MFKKLRSIQFIIRVLNPSGHLISKERLWKSFKIGKNLTEKKKNIIIKIHIDKKTESMISGVISVKKTKSSICKLVYIVKANFDTIIIDHCLLTNLFLIRNAIKESRNCCFSQKPKFNYELF